MLETINAKVQLHQTVSNYNNHFKMIPPIDIAEQMAKKVILK